MSRNEDVVELLRDLLARAETGEITAVTFGVVGDSDEDGLAYGVTGDLTQCDAHELIAYGRVIEHELIEFLLEGIPISECAH